jgi:hypothetical protein
MSRRPDWLWDTVISPEIKRPVRKFDHSPPRSARLSMSGAIPPLFFYAFVASTETIFFFFLPTKS